MKRAIVLFAKIEGNHCASLLEGARKHANASVASKNCSFFHVLSSAAEEPKHMAFVEHFESTDHWAHHRESANKQEFAEQLKGGSFSVTSRAYNAIGGGPGSSCKSAPIALIVTLEVQAQHMDAFLAEVNQNAQGSRNEQGCGGFYVCQSLENPRHFLLYETYASQQAITDHTKTPHFERYRDFALPLLNGDRVRTLYAVEHISAQ